MQHQLAALFAAASLGTTSALAQPPQMMAANGQIVGWVDSAFGTVIRFVNGNAYEITGVSIKAGWPKNYVFDFTTSDCSGQEYVEAANTSYAVWPGQIYAGELWGPKPVSPSTPHLAAEASVSLASILYVDGTGTPQCQPVSPPVANSILTPVYPLQNVSALQPPFYATNGN